MNNVNLSDEIRYKLFKLVDENPELNQRELAQKMGMSVGKLNYCLRALIDIGMLKVGNFAKSSHKFGYVYLLTPKGISEKAKVTSRFLNYKEQEYEALQKEIEVLREDALRSNNKLDS